MLRRRSQLIQRKMHLKAENKWKTVDRLTIYLKDQQHQNKICYRNKPNVSAPIPAEEQMPMSFFWTFLVLFYTALGETEIWWHGTCHKCPCCSWCKRVNKKTWGGRATKAKVKKLLKNILPLLFFTCGYIFVSIFPSAWRRTCIKKWIVLKVIFCFKTCYLFIFLKKWEAWSRGQVCYWKIWGGRVKIHLTRILSSALYFLVDMVSVSYFLELFLLRSPRNGSMLFPKKFLKTWMQWVCFTLKFIKFIQK